MPHENPSAFFAGTGVGIPDTVLTNADLERRLDTTDEWIRTMTGIRERRIAEPDQAASDLAAAAAEEAMLRAGVVRDDVDMIIVATGTADFIGTATACVVQERLGMTGIPAFDVTASCTGFIYATAVGSQFIATGFCRTIVVIGTEVFTRLMNWEDRATSVLAGDGAGAVVLQPAPAGQGILSICLGADGSGLKHLYIPGGGFRTPVTAANIASRPNTLTMDGQEIFQFAMKMMPRVTEEAIQKAGVQKEEVALVIPHQANIRIIEAAARRLDIPLERFMINIDRYGNTSAASIPIALHEGVETGRIRPGDVIVLTGFGAGLTWGAMVVRWPDHPRGR